MANKITTVLEFVGADGASKQIKRLSQDFQKAEGASAKFKVASAGFKDVLKQNVAQAAAVAGTALVAFGVSAVKDFTDSAVAAGRFADATGLSAEQASRWAEIAGDVGVEQSTIEGGFVRLEKAIASNSPAVEDLGIKMQYGADGTADLSATMLDAIERLNGIKDPAERAQRASELFGKGYAQMAEIVMGDSQDLKAALEGVSEAQIFDEEEIEKAREMRARLDELNDRLTALKLNVGEFTIDVIDGFSRASAAIHRVGQDFRAVFDEQVDANRAISAAWSEAEAAAAGFDRTLLANVETGDEARRVAAAYTDDLTAQNIIVAEWSKNQEAAKAATEDTTDAVDGLAAQGDRYVETLMRAGEEQDNANRSLAESRDRAAEASRNIQALDTEWQQLQGTLSDRRSLLDVSDAFDNLEVAAETAFEAAKTGGREAETAARDHERSLIDLKLEVGRYGEEVLNLPDASITVIQSLIDQGKFAEAEAQLAWLSRGRDIPLTPKVGTPGGSSYFARGTQSAPAGLAVVGEEGPELVAFRGGEKVFTAGQTRSMLSGGSPVSGGGGSINITVNAGMGTDGAAVGRQIVKALNEYKRSGGQVNI